MFYYLKERKLRKCEFFKTNTFIFLPTTVPLKHYFQRNETVVILANAAISADVHVRNISMHT
jgi:hypothetical protein